MNIRNAALLTVFAFSCTVLNVQAENITICQAKKNKAIRFAKTCKVTENTLLLATAASTDNPDNPDSTLDDQVADLTSRVSLLEDDIAALQNVPAADHIYTFENDYLKATVVGISKFVDADKGQAYFTASFQLKNKSTANLYLLANTNSGIPFTVVDNHGVSVTGKVNSGILTQYYESYFANRASYSVIAPGSTVSIGAKTDLVTRDGTSHLGDSFNLSFELVKYLDVDVATSGKWERVSVGFAGVALSK